jgi:steroid delta-isomerase-like uncharacterized protein
MKGRSKLSSAESNRRLIEEWVEAFNLGDMDAAAGLFADEGLNLGMKVGRMQVRAVLDDMQTRFPDMKVRVQDWVVQLDWVVMRCTYSGTHLGVGRLPVDGAMLIGVPATGKTFEVQHIHMFRMRDGKIQEHWACRDDVGMMRQLGLIPPPATSPAGQGALS